MFCFTTTRKKVDVSKVPKINFDTDVTEKFVKGSGPGGMNVNSSVNAVTLVHVQTKVFVKCHETRSLEKNRVLARERLTDALGISCVLTARAKFVRLPSCLVLQIIESMAKSPSSVRWKG